MSTRVVNGVEFAGADAILVRLEAPETCVEAARVLIAGAVADSPNSRRSTPESAPK